MRGSLPPPPSCPLLLHNVLWACSAQWDGLVSTRFQDSDGGLANQTVDVISLPFDKILKGELPRVGWHHLYGLGAEARDVEASGVLSFLRGEGGKHMELKRNSSYYHSEWCGKLLLTLSVEKQRDERPFPEKLMRRGLNPPPLDPPTELYELRCAVLCGTDMTMGEGEGDARDEGEVWVEAVVEEHVYRTQRRRVSHGAASFLKKESTPPSDISPGVLRKINHETALLLPVDERQLPDVLVYVCDSKGRRVAFTRFEGREVMEGSMALSPVWTTMKPTAPFNANPGELCAPRPGM